MVDRDSGDGEAVGFDSPARRGVWAEPREDHAVVPEWRKGGRWQRGWEATEWARVRDPEYLAAREGSGQVRVGKDFAVPVWLASPLRLGLESKNGIGDGFL